MIRARIGGDLLDVIPDFKNLPAPVEPRFWKAPDGTCFAWNEYGDPAGMPVFYYHGWPSSRLQARLAHPAALERGLRIISMDRPGIGRSSLVPKRRLEAWPGWMAGFADSLKIDRFAQLGVSGGGPYALACAALAPARLSRSAVLCGAVPLAPGSGGMRGLHPLYQLIGMLRGLPPAVFSPALALARCAAGGNAWRLPLASLMRTLPECDRQVLEDFPEILPVFVESFHEGVRQGGPGVLTDAAVYFQDWPFRFEDVTQPIRYWHGGLDRNIPCFRVEEMVRKIPGAELHIEPEMGHFSLALRRVGAALDYLAEGFRRPLPY